MTSSHHSWRLTVVLLASIALFATPARADVGVEKISRPAGAPGDLVKLTVACGFCYPPCHGAPGHRNTPCMLGTKRQPPEAFPVSLAPIERAPKPHKCGPNSLCSPVVSNPPARDPFTFLGEAIPPANIDSIRESGRSYIPRYLLDFTIPDLAPGVYTYVIFCDRCMRGDAGSLIASPATRLWRLRVRPADPEAAISTSLKFIDEVGIFGPRWPSSP